MPIRLYLAGPDVFFPDPLARADALRTICTQHGLQGVSPLDPLPGFPGDDAAAIARRNEAHIRRADAVIANLTPFRGPSLDCGTAYEIGFARALGRPVFGWSPNTLPYAARVAPGDGFAIEDFGLADNLMIACGLAGLVAAAAPDLVLFERCVALAAAYFQRERRAITSITSMAGTAANTVTP